MTPRTARHRPLSWLTAAVMAAAVVAGGCGGDDDAEATSTTVDQEEAAFCADAASVEERLADLQGVQLATDEDVPAVKEAVGDLLRALRDMLDDAPSAISHSARELGRVVDDIGVEVDKATTAVELGLRLPGLLAQLSSVDGPAADGGAQDSASAEVFGFASRRCPR